MRLPELLYDAGQREFAMSDSQDVEISLGTGRLLALFFGMVVVCAIFFGLGYSLGKNSAPVMASEAPATAANAEKPKAGAPSSSDELTFYKSVEQKDANAQLTPAPAPSAAAPANPAPTPASTAEAPRPGSGYAVQVAAVTKQEDAQALVTALRKKNYPVFVASNAPTDSLYHVQVGPFADIKDAEIMRTRLSSDGYNPILKK